MHAAEDLLKAVAADPTSEAIDALLKTCDAVPPMIEAPVDGGVIPYERLPRVAKARRFVRRNPTMVAGAFLLLVPQSHRGYRSSPRNPR